jgi:hypothetical protein
MPTPSIYEPLTRFLEGYSIWVKMPLPMPPPSLRDLRISYEESDIDTGSDSIVGRRISKQAFS